MKALLPDGGFRREMGFPSAVTLVVGNMVGTGVFTTSGLIMKELGDPSAMLLAWLVGGLFALSGALCYGELGAMFPKAGGEYVFLRESFGKGVAFLSGWISLIVGFSAPIAAASIAFSAYFLGIFPQAAGSGITVAVSGMDILTFSPATVLASAVVVALSIVHCRSVAVGKKVQAGLTLFKAAFLALFLLAAYFLGKGIPSGSPGPGVAFPSFGGAFPVALVFVSFAYSGWNAATYVGGEIRNPGRNIPASLCAGTIIVMFLYLALNMVFLRALSPGEMSGVIDVGARAAESLFGSGAGRWFGGAIAIGLLSVLSAMIMAGPRVYYAMAKDGVFFDAFGKVDPRHRTPVRSIILQATLSIAMILTASFESLLVYAGFTLSLSAVLTVAGLMRLRLSMPLIEREYKTFGYPLTPVLFILGNIWIIYYTISNRFVASLYGFATIGAGVLIYLTHMLRNREIVINAAVTEEARFYKR